MAEETVKIEKKSLKGVISALSVMASENEIFFPGSSIPEGIYQVTIEPAKTVIRDTNSGNGKFAQLVGDFKPTGGGETLKARRLTVTEAIASAVKELPGLSFQLKVTRGERYNNYEVLSSED